MSDVLPTLLKSLRPSPSPKPRGERDSEMLLERDGGMAVLNRRNNSLALNDSLTVKGHGEKGLKKDNHEDGNVATMGSLEIMNCLSSRCQVLSLCIKP